MSLREKANRQRELLAKIIADETWFEGCRRGCPVDQDDPVVQEHVADVLLKDHGRCGRWMAETVGAESQ